MCEDTFVSTYQKAFGWPWELPVKLRPWPPPRSTCVRDLTCPQPPEPECPCPHHTWKDHAGHYACLAEKESLIHRASQRVRDEIAKREHKKAEEDKKPDCPPLLRDDPKRSCYQIDYARKDITEISFVEMLEKLETTLIPTGPLGRTLYGSYTDPTQIRTSFYTTPLYDKSRPVAKRGPEIVDKYYKEYPGSTEYTDKYSCLAVKAIMDSQRWKYPRQMIEYKLPKNRAITAK